MTIRAISPKAAPTIASTEEASAVGTPLPRRIAPQSAVSTPPIPGCRGSAAQTLACDAEATERREPLSRPKGKAQKDENGKWQPTGDYEVGFGRPPIATQFSGKPGPGRPKGSSSYKTVLLSHLNKRRSLTVDGRKKSVTQGEVVIMTTIRDAMEGKNRDARRQVLSAMERYMPGTGLDQPAAEQPNASDELTMAEFYQTIRAEIMSELGLEVTDKAGDGA